MANFSNNTMAWFERRWAKMQSDNIKSVQTDMVELQNNLIELEKTMIYLTAKLATNQPINLDDPVVNRFMHLGDEEDPHRAALEIIAHLSAKRGGEVALVECPNCNAKVKDIKGVTDEVCTWCGHQLTTAD